MINWKRIVIFTFLIYIASAAASFPFGFIAGFLTARGQQFPYFIKPLMTISSTAASIFVIVRLVKIQKDKIDVHAWIVGFGDITLGLIFEIILLNLGLKHFISMVILTVFSVFIGLYIGKRIYNKKTMIIAG